MTGIIGSQGPVSRWTPRLKGRDDGGVPPSPGTPREKSLVREEPHPARSLRLGASEIVSLRESTPTAPICRPRSGTSGLQPGGLPGRHNGRVDAVAPDEGTCRGGGPVLPRTCQGARTNEKNRGGRGENGEGAPCGRPPGEPLSARNRYGPWCPHPAVL